MREHKRDRGRLEDILKYAKNVETTRCAGFSNPALFFYLDL